MKLLYRNFLFLCPFLVFVSFANAQWKTETFHLKAGWNAVFVHVDASHQLLRDLVSADEGNPIEQIWQWVPAVGSQQFFEEPVEPVAGSSQWLKWDRFWESSSQFHRLIPNAAYLVYVREGVSSYEWRVQGKPVLPDFDWSSAGLNLTGFSTPEENPPFWVSFLGPARDLHNRAEIYHYIGGEFGAGNPALLPPALYRSARVNRGQAYWVRAEGYNRYFGPFEVVLTGPGGIHFGGAGQYRFRLRNRIDGPLTVRARVRDSEEAPPGEERVVGGVPLVLRGELDLADLTYPFTHFSGGFKEWVLAPKGEPGSEVEIVLGLDRSALGGEPGDFFASILELSDAAGLVAINLPVSARAESADGLWVGSALVTEVAHDLVQYETDEELESGRVQNADGSYVVSGTDRSFGAVARPFPLRLIVHNGGGGARLLQRVYHGAGTDGGVVLSLGEDALDPVSINEAKRISATHLPFSEENVSWLFDGSLGRGAEISVSVPLSHDNQATNPFLHTYHPDHDNLDARFENELPPGRESYGITRTITLRVQPSGGDFSGVTAGSGVLSGIYEETVSIHGAGQHTQEYRVRGGFALNRVSDIDTLVD